MVVANVSTQSIEVKKKTRRKQTKKAPRVADLTQTVDEQDEDMDSAGGPSNTSGSADQVVQVLEVNTEGNDDDALMIDDGTAPSTTDPSSSTPGAISFAPLSAAAQQAALAKKSETRRIPIPPHRMTPLKNEWVNVFGPLTELLGLQVRMNVPRRCVEVRVRQCSL